MKLIKSLAVCEAKVSHTAAKYLVHKFFNCSVVGGGLSKEASLWAAGRMEERGGGEEDRIERASGLV